MIESAQILHNAETYNIEAEENRLSIEILKAYLEVLATQELLNASKNQFENLNLLAGFSMIFGVILATLCQLWLT